MKAVYPDYDHSLLSVISSILHHYGIPPRHKTLPLLDEALAKDYQNVVLLLLDGLGMNTLTQILPEDSFLRRHLRGALSSVFPPTTTAATTTLETGLAPVEHGWLGWSLYFKELDAAVELFWNTVKGSGGRAAADYKVAERYMPLSLVYNRITATGKVKANSVSPFGQIPAKNPAELFAALKNLCGDDERRYLYAYSLQPDAFMHKFGCSSPQTKEVIEDLDRRIEQFCDDLEDTLLIVTADHGLLDVRYRFVTDYLVLAEMLARPLSLEARAVSFCVKPGCEDAFREEFNRVLSDDFLLLSQDEVTQKELFGQGPEHPRFRENLGDFLAISISDAYLAYDPAQETRRFRAAHAGMTETEMTVPLILVEKE